MHIANKFLQQHQQLQVFVEFFGWLEDPDFVFLPMEYLTHGDLSSYITKGISEIDAKGICLQLLEGLEIMHEKSFTHRDLKPQVHSPSRLQPLTHHTLGSPFSSA